MKYFFEQLKTFPNFQIADGYVVIQVTNGHADVDINDKAALKTAEQLGGVPVSQVTEDKPAKKKVSKSND